jgi:hypothetical protein
MTLGFKDFVAGDVLTAAQVDGYLMRQTVMVFATDAARDSALSGNLEEGMHAYTEDNNRHYYYTGAAWVILSEPRQSWAPTVTQGSSITGTVNRGWYRRSEGHYEARLVFTCTNGGTPTEPIVISAPETAASVNDLCGTYGFEFLSNSPDVFYQGELVAASTTSVQLSGVPGATTTNSLGATITIANTDVIRLHLFGTY